VFIKIVGLFSQQLTNPAIALIKKAKVGHLKENKMKELDRVEVQEVNGAKSIVQEAWDSIAELIERILN
jgi:hypothetical protein